MVVVTEDEGKWERAVEARNVRRRRSSSSSCRVGDISWCGFLLFLFYVCLGVLNLLSSYQEVE